MKHKILKKLLILILSVFSIGLIFNSSIQKVKALDIPYTGNSYPNGNTYEAYFINEILPEYYPMLMFDYWPYGQGNKILLLVHNYAGISTSVDITYKFKNGVIDGADGILLVNIATEWTAYDRQGFLKENLDSWYGSDWLADQNEEMFIDWFVEFSAWNRLYEIDAFDFTNIDFFTISLSDPAYVVTNNTVINGRVRTTIPSGTVGQQTSGQITGFFEWYWKVFHNQVDISNNLYQEGYSNGWGIGYTTGKDVGYNLGLQAANEEIWNGAYRAGRESTLGTFMTDFKKWIVPAIITVMFIGGLFSIIVWKCRNSE